MHKASLPKLGAERRGRSKRRTTTRSRTAREVGSTFRMMDAGKTDSDEGDDNGMGSFGQGMGARQPQPTNGY